MRRFVELLVVAERLVKAIRALGSPVGLTQSASAVAGGAINMYRVASVSRASAAVVMPLVV